MQKQFGLPWAFTALRRSVVGAVPVSLSERSHGVVRAVSKPLIARLLRLAPVRVCHGTGCTVTVRQVSHEVHTTLDSLQSQLYSTTRSPELPSRSEYATYSALPRPAPPRPALHCTAHR